ncbi:D-alanyl-D-alanine carboxypeptidase/D-alanyl-D-alanine endopeptidase [Nocardioides alcanivorans]|uniref:D-alanyl-D-alanine carboxypeptidase/D-alanyl-D-alanine endopeptidase n=1 Tax=Nocardioides alcanivorans TaxID=2897352 RepID=UPI001F2E9E21|nr:D-alanyl-D-alanine carboxypeptidase/D-alanyl-D-alanine-endopeptidase [Nocardioides alcanivorans]
MTRTTGHRRLGGPSAWLPVALVLAVLATAFIGFEIDLGKRLGIAEEAPAEPQEVPAPEGLDLPELAAPVPVAAPAATDSPISRDAVRRAVQAALANEDLGPHVIAAVGAPDGTLWWDNGTASGTPASLMKLATGLAALESLGPDHTFRTSVRRGERADTIVLVGGGDPFLATEPSEASAWPQRADLTTLAAETAAALLNAGTTRVRLRFDDTLFDGPGLSPEWEPGYFPSEVAPITSLWADEGKDKESQVHIAEPAQAAARTFAGLLRDAGVKVKGKPRTGTTDGAEIAGVDSAPVQQIAEHVIAVSDNNGAEVLARHVGIAEGTGADFGGGTQGVREVLKRLGIPLKGTTILDGSGLSRHNVLTARSLLAVLATAAEQDHLRGIVEGLPVAGFSGSATYRLASSNPEGLGRVRAKTGTLTGVHGFAGTVLDVDGTLMTFVILADKVDPMKALGARKAIDDFTADLAACHCG